MGRYEDGYSLLEVGLSPRLRTTSSVFSSVFLDVRPGTVSMRNVGSVDVGGRAGSLMTASAEVAVGAVQAEEGRYQMATSRTTIPNPASATSAPRIDHL